MDSMKERVERNEKKAQKRTLKDAWEAIDLILRDEADGKDLGAIIDELGGQLRDRDNDIALLNKEVAEAYNLLSIERGLTEVYKDKERVQLAMLGEYPTDEPEGLEPTEQARLLEGIEELLNGIRATRELFEEQRRSIVAGMSPPEVATREPKVQEPIFKIMTDGKRYAIQKSINGGDTWRYEEEVKRQYMNHSIMVDVGRRTYRGAKKYIRDHYGKGAHIQPKQWRQV